MPSLFLDKQKIIIINSKKELRIELYNPLVEADGAMEIWTTLLKLL